MDALQDQDKDKVKPPVKDDSPVISASLQPIGSTQVNTHSDTLPVYYVIVGCGTAAVVNHTTLRQTDWGKNRIGGLPVMHIGFKDPWWHYFTHGMGQPPYLLTMPGYHQRPSQESDVFEHNPGCRSDRFAACTDREWNLLWAKYHTDNELTSKFHYKEGWVAVIQSKANPASAKVMKVIGDLKDKEKLDLEALDLTRKIKEPFPMSAPPYRLLVVVPETETSWKLEFVYAEKIDICTGAGRPRIPEGAWLIGKSKLWIPPRLWGEETRKRKIITGPEALIKETRWQATDRVYVNGAGGIGLNMVERGEGEGCYVDWLTARTLHPSFNLPRNDPVLRHPTKNLYNVDKGKKETLQLYLEGKFNNAAEIGVLVVPWLKSKKFLTKENLKSELILKRSEIIAGRGRGADFFGSIASSDEILEALDPAKEYSEGLRMKENESGIRVGPFLTPTKTDVILTPSDKKWRFGGGSDLDIVKIEELVTVKIKGSVDRANRSAPPGTPKIRDYFETDTDITDKGAFVLSDKYKDFCRAVALLDERDGGKYNRICVALGIVAAEFGEPSSIAADFTFDNLTESGRTVGLQADSKNIRILGAAAQVHPKNAFKINTPNQTVAEEDSASKYFFTLPMSAVAPGFIFTGINIALANNYFDYMKPNYNVNTMTIDELKDWILEEHLDSRETDWAERLAETLALAVVKHRRANNGYADAAAIKRALDTESSLTSLTGGWEPIVAKLESNYPPARDFVD